MNHSHISPSIFKEQYSSFKDEKTSDLCNQKVWYNERGGFIYQSYFCPMTGKIQEKCIPNNQPQNFNNFLYNYFTQKLN